MISTDYMMKYNMKIYKIITFIKLSILLFVILPLTITCYITWELLTWQSIIISAWSNSKTRVICNFSGLTEGGDLHPESHVLFCGHLMNSVQSQPMISICVPKAGCILWPGFIEIHGVWSAHHDTRPSHSSIVQVTVRGEGFHVVHSTLSLTRRVHTMAICWVKEQEFRFTSMVSLAV